MRRGKKYQKGRENFLELKVWDLWTTDERKGLHQNNIENFQGTWVKRKSRERERSHKGSEFRKAWEFLGLDGNDMIPSKSWEEVLFSLARICAELHPQADLRVESGQMGKDATTPCASSQGTGRVFLLQQRANEGRGKQGSRHERKDAGEGAAPANSWASGPRTSLGQGVGGVGAPGKDESGQLCNKPQVLRGGPHFCRRIRGLSETCVEN